MISELTLRPKATNKRAQYLIVAFLFGAAAFFVVYLAVEHYKGLIGLGTLAFITAAVFIYTKYIAPEYYYDILIANDTPLFVIRQLTGKRYVTLCRIELRSIMKVERASAQERREHKTPDGFVKYVYTPSLGPDTVYIITSVSRYEKAEITIEANDEFAALLTSYAIEARESYVED